ncbi:MAG: hypothetical protein Q8L48_08620 [Archangium sp.]|nr:hypothetical protein [Archangium sp.]
MRWVLPAGLLMLGGFSCAGFKSVERGEWRLVYVDSAKRDADAPREVVTRDAYETEVTEGTRRGWEPTPGFVFPLLHEVDKVGLKVGEVMGFRVDEASEATLFVDGGGVDLYWGPVEKRDGWKVDTDVTVRESMLYVKGTRAGAAVLRLIRGPTTKDVPVTVK